VTASRGTAEVRRAERGPEVCRVAPSGSELRITVYAYPEAPSSTYSDFELSEASESATCE